MDPQNQMYYFPPPPPQMAGPTLAPYHFYGGVPPSSGPAQAPFGPLDPDLFRPSSPLRVKSPSPSPVKPPKRPRGRPRKDKTAIVTAAKVAKTKAAASTRTSTTTKRKQKALITSTEKEKENEPPFPAPITIGVDDSSDSEAEGARNKPWSDKEKTKVYTFFLGDDTNGNHRFDQLKTNPGRVYKRCEEVVFADSGRTAKSIQGLWGRSKDIYSWIRAFEAFTGNGGGDPDSDDPLAVLAHRLKGARKAALTVGALKPETIMAWEKHGWLDLFNARYGKNPKVARQVVRSSASAISDVDDDATADLSQHSDDDINPTPREPKTPAPRKAAAAIVSERKHTPGTQLRTQTSNSFSTISELLKIKMVSEEKRSKAIEERGQLDRQKFELEQSRVKTEADKAKADMARAVLSDAGVSAEVKDAANGFLLNLFKN